MFKGDVPVLLLNEVEGVIDVGRCHADSEWHTVPLFWHDPVRPQTSVPWLHSIWRKGQRTPDAI